MAIVHLTELGLWNEDVKNEMIAAGGSIQKIKSIPDELKALYKTVWEIKQRVVLEMAADRGAFIDQSQSLNVHIAEPNYGKLSSMHFYAWKLGLKTGMYYLRTKPAAQAIQFTVDKTRLAEANKNKVKQVDKTDKNPASDKKADSEEKENVPEETEEEKNQKNLNMAVLACSLQNKEDCMMCGS